jgi:hypothetical protein
VSAVKIKKMYQPPTHCVRSTNADKRGQVLPPAAEKDSRPSGQKSLKKNVTTFFQVCVSLRGSAVKTKKYK